MNEFRRGDVVLVAGTVVAVDDDTVRVTINGIEAVVSHGDATLVRKSFHPGDEITSGHEDAVIVQTIEDGIHLVNIPSRSGAAAYQVVDESGLAHRDKKADPAKPAKTETEAKPAKVEPAPAPASASTTAPASAPASAEPAARDAGAEGAAPSGEPTPRFVFEKPGAAPKFTDRAGEGEEEPLELGTDHLVREGGEEHGDGTGAAADLAGSLGDGAHSAPVDIDLEEIGVTKDFRPIGERGSEEA